MKREQTKTTDLSFTVVKRAVLYARVSGDDRKYSTSGIEGQLNDCRQYARDKGYTVIAEFFEEPDKYTSGYDWLPELDKLLKLAEKQAFDILIVRELDRLSRNRFRLMSIENQLETLGIKIEYVIGQYEDSPEGRLLKGLMGEFAEYERNKIRQRIVRGMIKAVEGGNVFTGGSIAPYGYEISKEHGKRVLTIKQDEAAVVRLIFDFYVNRNHNLTTIANYLNERSTPRAAKGANHVRNVGRGKGKSAAWKASTVHSILSKEVYIGRWYYRKTERVKDPRTGKVKMRRRPRDEWLMIEVPAIISGELFEIAQKQRDRNKRTKKNSKYDYLLGGTVICGHCGYSATGFTTQWASYYVCNAKRNPKQFGFKCEDAKFIRMELLDAAVWGWLRSILLDDDRLEEVLEQYEVKQTEAWQPIVGMIEANKKKLVTLETKKARLIKAYSAGILSLDEVASEKAEVDDQIKKLSQAIAELETELPARLSIDEKAKIHELAAQVRRGFDIASDNFSKKRELIEILKVRVGLRHADGIYYADVSCVLGDKSIDTNSVSTI